VPVTITPGLAHVSAVTEMDRRTAMTGESTPAGVHRGSGQYVNQAQSACTDSF
jgi:hypothetical protein